MGGWSPSYLLPFRSIDPIHCERRLLGENEYCLGIRESKVFIAAAVLIEFDLHFVERSHSDERLDIASLLFLIELLQYFEVHH